MKKTKRYRLLNIFTGFLLIITVSIVTAMVSQNYMIGIKKCDSSGGRSSSTNYKERSSIGQISSGDTGSTNYKNYSGYVRLSEKYAGEYVPGEDNEKDVIVIQDPIFDFEQKTSLPVKFNTTADGNVEINVLSSRGVKIRNLLNESRSANSYTVTWDGKNDNSQTVGSGIYFIYLETDRAKTIKKVVLIR